MQVLAAGDARQGWVSAVFHALVDAGVMVAAPPDLTEHLMRYDGKGVPMPSGGSAVSPGAAHDSARTAITGSSPRRMLRRFSLEYGTPPRSYRRNPALRIHPEVARWSGRPIAFRRSWPMTSCWWGKTRT